MIDAITQKIKDIHESDLFGFIIETGCGCTITNQLMSISGASKTIAYSKQPYSKEYEKDKYGKHEYNRSVSYEFMRAMFKEEPDTNSHELRAKMNFSIMASWQLNDGDNDKMTHGWFAVKMKKYHQTRYFHFYFPKSLNVTDRQVEFNMIGDLAIEILHKWYFEGEDGLANLDTFARLDQAYIDNDVDYKLLFTSLNNNKSDYPLLFKDDKPVRFEEFLRLNNKIILQKGSFNPLHHQHVAMLEWAEDKYSAIGAFMVSFNRYDKDLIDVEEMIAKIKNINAHGYYVLICKEPLFYDNFKTLMKDSKNGDHVFYFPVGYDTINRIYKTDLDESHDSPFAAAIRQQGMERIFSKKFKFVVYPRGGYDLNPAVSGYGSLIEYVDGDYLPGDVSSTKIRNGEMKNLLN